LKANRLNYETCVKLVACYLAFSPDEALTIAMMSYICANDAPDYKSRSIRNRYHHLRALDVTVESATEWCHKKYSLFETVAREMSPSRFS
jgi:hypothetical protein